MRSPSLSILLETDAPGFVPTPHRDKRNELAYVRLATERVALAKNASLEKVAEVTSLLVPSDDSRFVEFISE